MDLNDTIDISNVSEPPPILFPENTDFAQYVEKPKSSQPNSTTVYYYLNDEELPFKIEVPVHPSKLTLAYLKCALNRQNFKCYVVQTDPELQREVKVEITDDYAILKPNNHGHFEFYLLSSNELPVDHRAGNTLRTNSRKKRFVPTTNRLSSNFFSNPMTSGFPAVGRKQQSSSIYHNLGMHHQRSKRRPYRATMSDESTKLDDSSPSFSKKYPLRNYASDSETSADFTSVSEMDQKYRSRKRGMGKLRRRARSHSFLSTSCEDTDVSVRVDLLTVELHLNTGREFGLNVFVRKNSNYHGIYVRSVEPNSVCALDGRIKPNQLIIEVNGFPLDNYTCDDAIATIQNEVHAVAKRRGTLTLTLSESSHNKRQSILQLPDESVRPLDTETWRNTVNMCHNISLKPNSQNVNNFMTLPQIPPNDKNWPSSGVGSSVSNSMSIGRKPFHVGMPMDVVVNAMLDPFTGLNRRNHTQLNLTISDSFSGQDLINWLADNVEGLEDRKNCEKYSGELLRNGFIEQKFKKNSFTAYSYYTINESKLQSITTQQQMNTMKRGVLTPIDHNKPTLDETQHHKCGKFCKIKRFMCLHQRKPHIAKNN